MPSGFGIAKFCFVGGKTCTRTEVPCKSRNWRLTDEPAAFLTHTHHSSHWIPIGLMFVRFPLKGRSRSNIHIPNFPIHPLCTLGREKASGETICTDSSTSTESIGVREARRWAQSTSDVTSGGVALSLSFRVVSRSFTLRSCRRT